MILVTQYHRTDVLAALDRASRFGAFSLAAVRRILAAHARPKPLLDELADLQRAALDPNLGQDIIGPRPTRDYQHLLLSENADETPAEEQPQDQRGEGDRDTKPA